MTTVWVTIALLAVGTAAIKASGPLALGTREPSARALSVIRLVAPALQASLVVYETLNQGGDKGVVADERLVGVAVAAIALKLRAPMAAVVLSAAVATAVARAL